MMPMSDGLPTPPYGREGFFVVVVVLVLVVVVEVAELRRAANCSSRVADKAEVVKMAPSAAFVPFKAVEGTSC